MIFNQTFFQVIGKFISAITTLLSFSLITRFYGADGVGFYTLVLTYLAFFTIAADFGLNAYLLPYFNRDHAVWGTLAGMRILLALVLMVLAIGGSFFVPAPSHSLFFLAVLLGSFSILATALITTSNLVFQAKLRYDFSILAASVGSIVSLFAVWLLAFYRIEIWYFSIVGSLGAFVSLVVGIFFLRRFVSVTFKLDWKFIRKTFFAAWPISLTLLLNVVYFRIDTFILSFFRSLAEVGVYNFAYQFFQTALVLPTFIMNALYPLLLKQKEEDSLGIRRFILHASMIMFLIGLFGTIITWLISPWLITLISSGNEFFASITVLRILSLSFPAFFASAVLMWSLVTYEQNKKMFGVYLVALIINFFANLFFIPEYSYIAAAWVTVGSEYLILLLQAIILLKVFKEDTI